MIDICQSEVNQSMEAFTNCNNVHSSAVMALASLYNLGNVSENGLCTEKGVSFFAMQLLYCVVIIMAQLCWMNSAFKFVITIVL